MANTQTQTITVDRISNSGNAIAKEEYAGKTIHAPVHEVGETYEVRLTDKGGFFEAQLVDTAKQTQPRQPSVGPDTSDVGQDLVNPERNQSHSYQVRSSVAGGNLRSSSGQEQRQKMSRRKK